MSRIGRPFYCAPSDALQWQAIVRRLLFTTLLTEYAAETLFSLSLYGRRNVFR